MSRHYADAGNHQMDTAETRVTWVDPRLWLQRLRCHEHAAVRLAAMLKVLESPLDCAS
jgi:hypothetical protein